MSPEPISVVLRFPRVGLSRSKFEATLGRPVDRFGVSRDGTLHYAQINLPDEAGWADLVRLVGDIGPMVLACFERHEIGRPCVDFDRYLLEDKVMASFVIPSDAAMAMARWAFDVQVSVYLTSED